MQANSHRPPPDVEVWAPIINNSIKTSYTSPSGRRGGVGRIFNKIRKLGLVFREFESIPPVSKISRVRKSTEISGNSWLFAHYYVIRNGQQNGDDLKILIVDATSSQEHQNVLCSI